MIQELLFERLWTPCVMKEGILPVADERQDTEGKQKKECQKTPRCTDDISNAAKGKMFLHGKKSDEYPGCGPRAASGTPSVCRSVYLSGGL